MNTTQRPTRVYRQTRSTLLAVVAAVGLTAALTAMLHARAAGNETEGAPRALPVASTTFKLLEGYDREVSYLGLVKASRTTQLSFERPGLLQSVTAREGATVGAGDVLATLDTARLEAEKKATEAEIKRVDAELELARLKAERQQDLKNSGAVSREAHDETRLRAEALKAQGEIVRARLASVEIELDRTVMRAPYDGVIGEHHVDIGTVVNAGTPVLRIVEASQMEAHVGVAVEQADTLIPGNHYPLNVRGNEVSAELLAVRPDVHPLTRAVSAVFRLPATITVRDGEPASLPLTQPVTMRGGWLPISALLEGERGAWTVLKITGADNALSTVREVVEVLQIHGDQAFVRGTLASGDTVVADGLHRIAPGAAVTLAALN